MNDLIEIELNHRQIEILEAAGKILTKYGVSGLTIKNLASEMKFTESAIYRHFDSKEEIILNLLNYLSEELNKNLPDLQIENSNPLFKLNYIFQNQFNFFNKYPYFVVAVFSDGLFDESKKINEALLNIMNKKIQQLLPIIIEGQRKNIFINNINPDELFHIIMGSVKLLMFKWKASNFQFDIINAGNSLMQTLFTLIKRN